MSLRWRIVLAMAGVAALVGTLAATGAYITTSRQLYAAVDDSLSARASEANGSHPEDDHRPGRGPAGPPDDGCPTAGALQPACAAQLVAADGTVSTCIDGGAALPVDTDVVAAALRGSPQIQTVNLDDASYRLLTVAWHDGGVLLIARNLDEVDDVLTTLRFRLIAVAGAGIAVAGVLGWLVARRIVRPVVHLRDTAESIATTQDLTTPIQVGGPGEVGSLARSFTTMVGALATSREQQQRLVTDASHEMRTPLTSLRTNLELLEQLDRLPAEERAEVLEAVQVDVGELTHLLTELVELATDGSNDEMPEALDLGELVRSVVRRAVRRSGRDIEVIETAPDLPSITGRPLMLERAVSNLVDNAVKYSPVDGPIEVTVSPGRVEVRDHGPGIALEDQPLVFERFYRSTAARTEPGSGLGLAIVEQIVQRHGGEAWATNAPDGGAVVGFQLAVPARKPSVAKVPSAAR